jgi:predicted KAP-like P-loop ATPase
MGLTNDSPIEFPAEDLFGLDPFAHAVSASIRNMPAPAGVVLAISGAWGSGKSSAVNLIRHHLSDAIDAGHIVPVWFNPWWFSGSDALTLSFFTELNIALGPSLPKDIRNSLSAIGQGVSAIGPLLGAGANLKIPGVGAVVTGAMNLFAKVTHRKITVEGEHSAIAEALRAQPKKFLVIVDDIDRLSPDDALTMFRLVKSLGRLPNVIYLLAFDRSLAERAVSERFPSEGAGYLDKIIQASFDIPPPSPDALRHLVLSDSAAIFGEPDEVAIVRFMNVFYDVVAPALRTPRDAVRLVNTLSTTWPAVASNVDRADFLALAAIRLSSPAIYQAIRDHADELCGARDQGDRRADAEIRSSYDRMLCLISLEEADRESWRRRLRRLFPRLDAVWSNTWYSDTREWQRDRRICSSKHFPTYFAFAIPEDVIPADEMNNFVLQADDANFVRQELCTNLAKVRANGTSRAALLLEELTVQASVVPEQKIPVLVSTLFSIIDDLDISSDELRGFGFGDNPLRLHWLLNQLVTDRFDLGRREEIYGSAMATAATAWAVDFASRCHRYFEPREDGRDLGSPIVSQAVAERFLAISLDKLRAAATDGTLIKSRRLARLLFAWKQLSKQGAEEVREWTSKELSNDLFVVAMAKAIPSVGWTQGMGFDGMGDHVARKTVTVNPAAYQDILDVSAFESQVERLLKKPALAESDRQALDLYCSAPRGAHDAVLAGESPVLKS